MNRRTKLITVLLVGLSVPVLSGHDGQRQAKEEPNKVKDDKVKELMRKKLENSQKLLEGVVTNDFDKISKHAEELMAISKSLEWKAIKSARYELHSNQFRRTIEDLQERAKEKNLDGAALSYVDLTLTCVKCHKYVRDSRMTERDDELSDGLRPQRTKDE